MKESLPRILFFILLLAFPRNSVAIFNRIPGSRSMALAGAVVALPGEEALYHNQAGISSISGLTISISFESAFLLKELSLMSCGVVLPTRAGTFGSSFYQFGTGVYREDKWGLVYSKRWGDRLSAALQFDYFSQRMPENPRPYSIFTFEAGVLYETPGNWLWGFHIFNPFRVKLKYPWGEETVPWNLRTGCIWVVSERLIFCSEIEKNEKKPLSLKTGIEFVPHSQIKIRAGISGEPLKFSAGAGFQMEKVRIDLAFSYHGNLGYSPSVSLTFTP